MEHSRKGRRLAGLLGLAVGAAMLLAAPRAFAGPNSGNVQFSMGMDFTTAYFFRGILQERDGFIWQPYGEVNVPFWRRRRRHPEQGRRSSSAAGTASSRRRRCRAAAGRATGTSRTSTPASSSRCSTPSSSSRSSSPTRIPAEPSTPCRRWTSPSRLNDAQWLDKFALNPSALMAWEVHNTALGHPGGHLRRGEHPAVVHGLRRRDLSREPGHPDDGRHERQRLLREPERPGSGLRLLQGRTGRERAARASCPRSTAPGASAPALRSTCSTRT